MVTKTATCGGRPHQMNERWSWRFLLKRVLRRLTWLKCRDTSQEKAGGINLGTKSCHDSNCSDGGEEWRQYLLKRIFKIGVE